MKRFSDLGIDLQDDRRVFECQQISITEVVNCEIEVIEHLSDVKTRHGDGRCLVRIKRDGREAKFFTNSKNIKCALEAVPKEAFPFITVIRCVRIGSNSVYKFT